MMSRFVLGLGNQGAPYTLYDMADDVHLLIEKWGWVRSMCSVPLWVA